jgi:hypothetical protein
MLKWVAGIVAMVVVTIGLWAFQPWRLFTSSQIDEPAPVSAADSEPPSQSEAPPRKTVTPQDEVLATGEFEDAEHDTNGIAKVIELGDGRRFVRLERLATSDGPDLHVWATDRRSGGPWGSYDDGRYLALGKLKATHGNQNYEIPDDADLSDLTSVVIWCDRFNVAFGTAPIRIS